MSRLAFGVTLIREFAVLTLCLADDARLASASEADFQDAAIRRALGAAKRLRANGYRHPSQKDADAAVLREAFKTLSGVEGDGKLIDLLTERTRAETQAAARRRRVSELQRAMQGMTAEQLETAIGRLS